MRYADRLAERIRSTGSRLCIGLDPRPGEGGAAAAEEFLGRVVGETAEFAAAFKPNSAYFEAMGSAGVAVLERVIERIPVEVPVILDVKRSDIGETQRYYAEACFGSGRVDAVTLNPFLGHDSLEPFLDWEGRGVYLLAVTSNPGSADMQRRKLEDGREVFELVIELGERARAEGRQADVGYVVGLTNAADVLARLPQAPLLIPGLGAQGGDLAALASGVHPAPSVVNVSRGILYADDQRSFGERAADWVGRIHRAVGD